MIQNAADINHELKKLANGGKVVKDIGIQGNIVGMDTRGMFDFASPLGNPSLPYGSMVTATESSVILFQIVLPAPSL